MFYASFFLCSLISDQIPPPKTRESGQGRHFLGLNQYFTFLLKLLDIHVDPAVEIWLD